MSPCCPHCGGERVASGERARCKACGEVLGLEPRRLDILEGQSTTTSAVASAGAEATKSGQLGLGGPRPLAFGKGAHI